MATSTIQPERSIEHRDADPRLRDYVLNRVRASVRGHVNHALDRETDPDAHRAGVEQSTGIDPGSGRVP